jgi:hypothetical protein
LLIYQGNTGFWVGHFWESSKPQNINGGSSFNYRFGPNPENVVVRPLQDFKTIATEPLLNPSPLGVEESFISLYDMKYKPSDKLNYNDPFGPENGGGDIYIITKSAGYV